MAYAGPPWVIAQISGKLLKFWMIISSVPAATRSPDLTFMCVIWPSTCGLIVVEWRDFSVATYSVVSFTFCGSATTICTGIAWPAAPAGLADCLVPQPSVEIARQRESDSRINFSGAALGSPFINCSNYK